MEYHEHQKKFENTELLIKESIMDPEKTIHLDWLVIIMYYGAYHLVHKHCAKRSNKNPDRCHPDGHGKTINAARTLKKGKELFAELTLLENECFSARYEKTSYNNEDVIELKKSYDFIKKILA